MDDDEFHDGVLRNTAAGELLKRLIDSVLEDELLGISITGRNSMDD